ncbi:hypothetical protein Ddye_015604 [Dipteronia dyeriana]|uniref:Uncharacterized protein n=1 Tax=Dipteronia dyeriana TaxID=168575 RepID=A0AAD9U606_9ROSI|nr:hypothetical protein Ddye_015604 [Dipteronia dyeriana]
MDPTSGFYSLTKIYHSLRPDMALPPPFQPLSITQFIFSLHHSITTIISNSTFLINVATGHCLSYVDLAFHTNSLALSLKKHYPLSNGDVSFILSFHSFHFPILYLDLFSLDVIISPAMPDEFISDVNRLVNLYKLTIAFTTSQASEKLHSYLSKVMLLNSPEFLTFFTEYDYVNPSTLKDRDVINQ